VQEASQHKSKISGYTTALDCVRQGYPFVECIASMLGFCDQVVVVDGGSTDGTWETLQEMQVRFEPRLVIHRHELDMTHPRFAVFDGQQKARARALCTGDFCWQMDCDEIVHEDDYEKICRLAGSLPRGVDIVSLPVIEYWGGPEKVRVDVQPWKWRLSRNLPHITHGIPARLRRFDAEGRLHAVQGTDGCDMIDARSGEPLEHVSFYTVDIEVGRRAALEGDPQALAAYEDWFNATVTGLPSVFHYSWHDLPRKIRLYRSYWTQHWSSLYGIDMPDAAENNFMFDAPWSQVTDEMIEERAAQMKSLLGGWIWHRKWDGVTKTPHIMCHRTQPGSMQKNLANH
jgi:glycosyltransferase involved in cell wall biosynthesis